jgi:hypothetical protein
MSMVFFTSATVNYLPKATVLAESIRRHRPGATVYLVLCDQAPPNLQRFSKAFDQVLLLSDLKLPVENMEQWIFQHTVVELCTAVKGPFLLHLFEQLGASKVVYLDPDIVAFDSFQQLETLLDAHSVIVTPHLVEPETTRRGIVENEICSLQHGTFNLGFLAVRNSAEGLRFARWWSDRLLEFCYDDIPNGLFTDQRWMDLAPGLFPDLCILRDKSYNVATWNLSHRRVEKGPHGELRVEGTPVRFFHFSGFDSGHQLGMLERYGQESPALFELREWYIQELERAGQSEYGKVPCGYEFFSNGKPILRQYRRVYRERAQLQKDFPRPATVEERRRSYYHWCAESFKRGRTPPERPPLLERWKRSIRKRIPRRQGT